MIEEMEPIESGLSVSCAFSSSSSFFSSSLRSCLIFEDEDEDERRPGAEGGLRAPHRI